MKCPKCGQDIPDGAQFCGNCGQSVTTYAQPVQPQTATMPQQPVQQSAPAGTMPPQQQPQPASGFQPVQSTLMGTDVPTKGRGKAIAALVLGIVGLVAWLIPIIGFIFGVLAVIFGSISTKASKGMAIAGIIMGSITILLSLASFGYNIVALNKQQSGLPTPSAYLTADQDFINAVNPFSN